MDMMISFSIVGAPDRVSSQGAIAYGTFFPRVVPANAGTHTPCHPFFALG
jgi:hypothetical protein